MDNKLDNINLYALNDAERQWNGVWERTSVSRMWTFVENIRSDCGEKAGINPPSESKKL